MVPNTERQDPIRKCFQSLHHVFRLIVKSRQLFSRATGGQNEDSFMLDIQFLFQSFHKMLSFTSGSKYLHHEIFTSLCLQRLFFPHKLRSC